MIFEGLRRGAISGSCFLRSGAMLKTYDLIDKNVMLFGVASLRGLCSLEIVDKLFSVLSMCSPGRGPQNRSENSRIVKRVMQFRTAIVPGGK